MVKLKVAVRLIAEDVYLASLDSNQPISRRDETRFAIAIPNPDGWYIGTLANAAKQQYESRYKRDLGKIKYLKEDRDDCDLDPEQLVTDILVDEGRALKDFSDQHVTIKVIQEQGRSVRADSVIPDLTPAHYRPPPRPIPPKFPDVLSTLGKRKAGEGEDERPVLQRKRSRMDDIEDDVIRSIELDQPQRSPVIIQDSQPARFSTQESPQFGWPPHKTPSSPGQRKNDTRQDGGALSYEQILSEQSTQQDGRRNEYTTPAQNRPPNKVPENADTRYKVNGIRSGSPVAATASSGKGKFLRRRSKDFDYLDSDVEDSQMAPNSNINSRITPRLVTTKNIGAYSPKSTAAEPTIETGDSGSRVQRRQGSPQEETSDESEDSLTSDDEASESSSKLDTADNQKHRIVDGRTDPVETLVNGDTDRQTTRQLDGSNRNSNQPGIELSKMNGIESSGQNGVPATNHISSDVQPVVQDSLQTSPATALNKSAGKASPKRNAPDSHVSLPPSQSGTPARTFTSDRVVGNMNHDVSQPASVKVPSILNDQSATVRHKLLAPDTLQNSNKRISTQSRFSTPDLDSPSEQLTKSLQQSAHRHTGKNANVGRASIGPDSTPTAQRVKNAQVATKNLAKSALSASVQRSSPSSEHLPNPSSTEVTGKVNKRKSNASEQQREKSDTTLKPSKLPKTKGVGPSNAGENTASKDNQDSRSRVGTNAQTSTVEQGETTAKATTEQGRKQTEEESTPASAPVVANGLTKFGNSHEAGQAPSDSRSSGHTTIVPVGMTLEEYERHVAANKYLNDLPPVQKSDKRKKTPSLRQATSTASESVSKDEIAPTPGKNAGVRTSSPMVQPKDGKRSSSKPLKAPAEASAVGISAQPSVKTPSTKRASFKLDGESDPKSTGKSAAGTTSVVASVSVPKPPSLTTSVSNSSTKSILKTPGSAKQKDEVKAIVTPATVSKTLDKGQKSASKTTPGTNKSDLERKTTSAPSVASSTSTKITPQVSRKANTNGKFTASTASSSSKVASNLTATATPAATKSAGKKASVAVSSIKTPPAPPTSTGKKDLSNTAPTPRPPPPSASSSSFGNGLTLKQLRGQLNAKSNPTSTTSSPAPPNSTSKTSRFNQPKSILALSSSSSGSSSSSSDEETTSSSDDDNENDFNKKPQSSSTSSQKKKATPTANQTSTPSSSSAAVKPKPTPSQSNPSSTTGEKQNPTTADTRSSQIKGLPDKSIRDVTPSSDSDDDSDDDDDEEEKVGSD